MRPTLAFALVSALIGCASGPRPPHAEFRDGITPIAPPAPYSASYLLHAGGTTVEVRQVPKGERLGFAREKDGSVVAVAPDFRLALTQPAYAWEVVSETVPSRGARIRERLRESVRSVGGILGTVAFVGVVFGLRVLYGIAESNSRR